MGFINGRDGFRHQRKESFGDTESPVIELFNWILFFALNAREEGTDFRVGRGKS
jgi:hypothetical protein